MSEPIRFYYQGKVHELGDVAPTRTVLQHLREDLHCTGTKEGCAEGDCGACTVVIGALEDGELALKAVNSCIQFAAHARRQGAVHGGRPAAGRRRAASGAAGDGRMPRLPVRLLHARLRDVAVGHVPEAGRARSRARCQIDDALSGNLCRCTGYRPIIDAARRMVELPRVDFDRAALAAQLRALQRDAWPPTAPAASTSTRRARSTNWRRCAPTIRHAAAAGRLHRRRPVGHQAAARPRRHHLPRPRR